jgi:MFS family permease
VGIYTQLMIWRFLLGFGVGGEYPLSATITTESSTNESRGRNVSDRTFRLHLNTTFRTGISAPTGSDHAWRHGSWSPQSCT